ncbi:MULTISPECIES: PspC domain-containing protein [Arthrobacter]|uniref:Phage shock protein PspC (Stress-responsive transcriptional regulator) n=1 Tax=Arthrobacter woluwensis TaxID=156980 RepID=A0A1H4M0U7_9MICC|nr:MULTISPECIES: PspC domain-containing protein [Arthrobacter]QTF72328.1 PspC domain-containing protein [Arthrobacter woluwensis]SEB76052.1 Phage shock protein PspC (stress-responsive transcriptional regulator) [Arthrobacter woluwensis]
MDKFFSIIRGLGLKRGPERWLGGVCGGLSAKFTVDVAWIRIGYLIFCLLPGPAFVVYLAAWLLLPDGKDDRIILQGFLQNRGVK